MGTYAVFYTYTNRKGVATKGQHTMQGRTIVEVIETFTKGYSAVSGGSVNVDTVVCLKATD